MKIISTITETSCMTKEEIDKFLESKLMLLISTIDEKGEPNIQPAGFTMIKIEKNLLVPTSKIAKKTQNLCNKPGLYFSIDGFYIKGVCD